MHKCDNKAAPAATAHDDDYDDKYEDEDEDDDDDGDIGDDEEAHAIKLSPSGAYPCPSDGCARVFQRLSALEKHLSLEKCKQKLERLSLLDRAKIGYKEHLEEGAGVIPTLNPTVTAASGSRTVPEGWKLKASKKAYRFNDKQKNYLDAKFNIGQETGRKMDPNVVSQQMRHLIQMSNVCLRSTNSCHNSK